MSDKIPINECNGSLNVNGAMQPYYSKDGLKDFGTITGNILIGLPLTICCMITTCILSTIFLIFTRTTYTLKKKWSGTTICLCILFLCCFSSFVSSISNYYKIKNNLSNVVKEGRPCVKDDIIYNPDNTTTVFNPNIYNKISGDLYISSDLTSGNNTLPTTQTTIKQEM